ncbi:four-carbon acid sugar kinase family protein [Micromonospora sp. NPDC092111]|uniref:four-carbon acid sugar kinase family protein n=1 Tax=Micromonospora sp. NPDC092111 TaxID=3364289 RepID=UPI003821F4BE
MPDLAIVADDLSGASEAAAAFLLRTTRIEVLLGEHEGATAVPAAARVVAVDTDSRRSDPVEAAARVRSALALCHGAPVLKKVDSLLRGNLASEVAALRDALDVMPVVATALPEADRKVIDGVLRVGGVPLPDTGLWHAEQRPAPRTVADALAPLGTVTVPLAAVRRGARHLAATLAAAASARLVAVCDAETDADLDAVYAAARLAADRPLLVGSAGLAAAAARAMPPDPPGPADAVAAPTAAAVLVVAGTAAASLRAQLAAVEPEADVVLRCDPQALLDDPSTVRREVTARLDTARCAVVSLDDRAGIRPDLAPRLVCALAAAVAPAATDGRALVLTGGETARAVLDRLGVARLRPVAQRAGAVLSYAGTGQVVVTRPGSFGGPTSLADLARTVLADPCPEKEPR